MDKHPLYYTRSLLVVYMCIDRLIGQTIDRLDLTAETKTIIIQMVVVVELGLT